MSAGVSDRAIFDWIRDQDEIVARLRAAVREDRVPQSYLFHGPRGVGKTRTALGLAQALNCEGVDRPCGSCLPCRKTANLIHPDVRLLFPTTRDEDQSPDDVAKKLQAYASDPTQRLEYARNSSIGIDRIRELKIEAGRTISEGRRRVFILSDATRMLEEASQSALKLLEEPPPATHLVLTVEEPGALLPTILSRCQQIRFRPLRRETVEGILCSTAGLGVEAARLIASLSGGSLGRAMDLKDEDSIVRSRDEAVAILGTRPDPAAIEARVRDWAGRLDPNAVRRNVELLLVWCHDLLVMKYDLPEGLLSNLDRKGDLAAAARTTDLSRIRAWVDALEELVDSTDRNVNPALAFYEALQRITGTPQDGSRGYE